MSDVHGVEDHGNNGSIDDAVIDMPDIDELEVKNGDREPEALRDDAGKFKAKEEDTEAGDDAETEQAASDDTEDDDGEYLEIAGEEEGAEPIRLKVDEVYQGYQRAQELETEVANLKATAPAPVDYDRAIVEAVTQGTQYLQGLKQVEQMLQPMGPNPDLINPNHPNYDPEGYFEQQQHAQAQFQQFESAKAERERVETELSQQQQALDNAMWHREQQKLMEIWPEVKEDAYANQVRADASKHYGYSAEEIDSVRDSRQYAVLKDALAYRALQSAKEAAVKVVKAKPKLVKAKARQNTKGRKASDGFERLQQTGSEEDAVAALDGLL